MTNPINRGELKLTIIIVTMVLIQVATALSRNFEIGWDKLASQIIQLIIHVGLLYLAFLGKDWAKWILTGSYFIVAIFGLISGMQYLNEGSTGLLLLSYSIFLVFSALFINLSSDIRRFLKNQKEG